MTNSLLLVIPNHKKKDLRLWPLSLSLSLSCARALPLSRYQPERLYCVYLGSKSVSFFSLSLSLSHSLFIILSRALSHVLSLSLSLYLSLSLTLFLSARMTNCVYLGSKSVSIFLSLSLSHSLFIILSLSLFLSFSRACALPLSLSPSLSSYQPERLYCVYLGSKSFSFSISLFRILSLSFSLSLSLSLSILPPRRLLVVLLPTLSLSHFFPLSSAETIVFVYYMLLPLSSSQFFSLFLSFSFFSLSVVFIDAMRKYCSSLHVIFS
ncbi:unnamed protein product [Acanthosepion pharaonis]|uniref:Uncharacterized protein n=1 Tax=Acanthosepion pharaonis TaxID=158019 RepID=A0A812CP98_ACAPH|nr:unnamed protein product [Sepia pharaonis]